MEPTAECARLQRRFTDPTQRRYELIRPLLLSEDRTATQRAQETETHPDTVRTFLRRFRQQGMLGLLPDHVEVSPRGRVSRVPEAVRQEIARLKALYRGFHYREVVRIIFYTTGYRLHPNTVKRLWQQDLPVVPGEFTLRDYHGQQDRYQARVQVIKLYYQGWNKLSIHMCPLKLRSLNYRDFHSRCWPLCAPWAGVSSRGADLKRKADGANWGLSRHA